MRYLKCTVSKPGLLENTILDFSDNPVIVYGRNGSGKTLIAKGLIDVLFRKLSDSRVVSDDAWNTLYMDVHLSLNDSRSYRLTSNGNRQYAVLTNINEEETVIMFRGDAGETVDRRDLPQYAQMMEFFSFINGTAFQTSSFIPSPTDLNPGETVSYASLKRMMMNDRSVCCHSTFANGDSARLSPWSELEEHIQKLDAEQRNTLKRMQLIDVSRNRMDKLIREKKNINKEIREINATQSSLGRQKKILQGIINDINEIENLNRELDEMHGIVLQEEEKAEQSFNLKKEIDEHFPHLQKIGLNEIPSLEELQDIFNGIKNLNEQIDSITFSRKTKKRRVLRTSFGVIIATAIALGALIIGSSRPQPVSLNMIFGIIASALFIISSLTIYYAATSKKKELEKLNQDKIFLENSIKEKIKGNRIDYDGEKVHELYDFLLQYFEDYLEFSEKTREYHRLTSSLKDRDYFDEITEKLHKLKSDEDEIKNRIQNGVSTLEIVKNIEINENEISNLIATIDREIENAGLKIVEKERILHQIDNETKEQPDNRDELKTLTKQKISGDKKLKVLHARMHSMNFIRDALAEAEKRRENKQLKKLVKNSLEKFNYLTANQYITKIDERIIQDILLNSVAPSDLNPAVIHAIVMSTKLSLTDIIANCGMALPLVIDDPFYNMDEARMKRFRDLIGDAAKSRQVILFTHQKEASDWGKFIEL